MYTQTKKAVKKILYPFKKIKQKISYPAYSPVFKIIKQDKLLRDIGLRRSAEQIANRMMIQQATPAAAFCEIATFLLNGGYPELGLVYHEHSLQLSLLPSTYSLYLQCLMLSPSCTEEQMFKAASKYDELFLSHIQKKTNHQNELTVNRKLRIGYICHFFHNSVSKSQLMPFLNAHHRDRVSVFCYSDAEPAEVPDYIKNIPDVWRDTKKLDDEALAQLIQEDKIDILIELNGHIIVNRYLTIARKPAPIQVSFYNIATTTGISTIDYVLVAEEIKLKKPEAYTERVYYFNGVGGVVKFANDFPGVAKEPPCLTNGYVTFGSFGAAQKVNREVIKLWCKVLKKVPNSRFYMKAGVLTYEDYLKSYQLQFAQEGIDLCRVIFEGFSPHLEMLECYSKVDIALDTFPHGAGTTTMEATWQGVPVLSLYGDRHCMQHGKVILESVGHPEFIAYTEDEFINNAAALAANPDRLIQYRKNLREDFKKSRRADLDAFAKSLEDAYFGMWEKYCRSKKENTIVTHE